MGIEVYGKEGCIKCRHIKEELQKINISFSYIDDMDKVLEKSKEFGTRELPIIIVDDKLVGFIEMKDKIKEMEEIGNV